MLSLTETNMTKTRPYVMATAYRAEALDWALGAQHAQSMTALQPMLQSTEATTTLKPMTACRAEATTLQRQAGTLDQTTLDQSPAQHTQVTTRQTLLAQNTGATTTLRPMTACRAEAWTRPRHGSAH